ncbi:hypothetical protein DUNSADRAFT_2062 [Dunaliella salina]|uniref:RRM domain-containing protein n=1 Tax=Dunaliella salina TaxID=3046 RepID=A0ABQ7FWX3_DUNSA|nr:hypothetical protein DUNSADRAFT_2062 [Dunaliella salina]|eukprot:KAF5826782.1 hypothetical protein DUNSADRAFT_2062 [Dunaliella salina]
MNVEDAFARFQADLAGVGQGSAMMMPGQAQTPYMPVPAMPTPAMFPTPTMPYSADYSQADYSQADYGQGYTAADYAAAGYGDYYDYTGAQAGMQQPIMQGKRSWRDPTLDEWPENDFRIFVGDLGNECNDDVLGKAFQKYPSFVKARIVKDKRTKKTKGFGFVSFMDSLDFAKALKEMNGKYIGNRPCKLRKSTWDERNAHLKKPQQQQQKK